MAAYTPACSELGYVIGNSRARSEFQDEALIPSTRLPITVPDFDRWALGPSPAARESSTTRILHHYDMKCRDLLDSLLDAVQDGFLFLDEEANILLANRWIEEWCHSELPLAGRKCYEVLHGRQDPCVECPYLLDSRPAKPSCVFTRESEQGSTEWMEATVHRIVDGSGRVMGAIEHIRDITERKQTEELLKDEISRRRILVEQSRDGIVVINRDGSVYEANKEYAHMLGYSVEEVYQLRIWEWNTDFSKQKLLEMLDTVGAEGDHFQTRHRRKDGTYFEVEISSNGAVIGGQKLIFCVCRDVTEKMALEEQIRELAIRDPLTNVYNRRYIFDRLGEMAGEHSRGGLEFCVSILDLDNFKTVNDTYGHAAGDFALKEFAHTLGSVIRKHDLLGRYGGEEFVIVSRSSRTGETAEMIDRIMETVRNRALVFNGQEIRLTFSCGLADSSEFSRDEFSIEALLSLADERLYNAKADGRNCFVCQCATLHLRGR